jgi:DNA-binding MarR family transcriptional regulator
MRTTGTERIRQARVVRRAVTSLAARARVERGGELSLNQVAVLGRVMKDGPVTPGEVALRLGMLPQSLTRTFAALEAAGYVRRMPDPGDGRQSLLAVTQEGRAAMRAEMAPRDRWVARAMDEALSPDERDALVAAAELIERLVEWGGGVAMAER